MVAIRLVIWLVTILIKMLEKAQRLLCRQKTCRYFRIEFHGFLEVRFWYSNLPIFWYQLFSFFIFYLSKSFSVYVVSPASFICISRCYNHTRLISAHSDKEFISVFSSGDCSLFLTAFNTCNLPLGKDSYREIYYSP